VFVANDWHAAMVPVYLASRFRPHGVYRGARTVAAIHNLIHQGVFPPSTFAELGVPGDWYGAMEWQYPPHQRMGSYEEEGRAINTLKAALTTADRIVTVSPGYAWEITTPEGGCGLETLLGSRSYVLDGVLNGVDVEEWSPATDKHLYKRYTAATVAEGKAANKAALQKELGLPVDAGAPLFAFIGRLDPQKGADLVLAAAPWLVAQGAQVVLLGSGDPRLEAGLRGLEAAHPAAARAWVGFNVPFSHRLTAAADVLLMPSVFEPCGLNQMYAFLAGTPVVAHATGGLRDTVVPYDPEDEANGSTGWTFSPCTTDAFAAACGHALTMYRDHPDAFARLRARCMARDCSWDGSAAQWEQIFDWSKSDPPYCP
jgi:starch synthase